MNVVAQPKLTALAGTVGTRFDADEVYPISSSNLRTELESLAPVKDQQSTAKIRAALRHGGPRWDFTNKLADAGATPNRVVVANSKAPLQSFHLLIERRLTALYEWSTTEARKTSRDTTASALVKEWSYPQDHIIAQWARAHRAGILETFSPGNSLSGLGKFLLGDTEIIDGWEYLGSGHFSSVWWNPAWPDVVVKFGRSGTKDGAYEYLKWARNNQDLYGTPTVFELEAYDGMLWTDDGYYLAVMEVYRPQHNAPWRDMKPYHAAGFFYRNATTANRLLGYRYEHEFTTKFAAALETLSFIYSNMPKLFGRGAFIDDGSDNVMIDEDNLPIFVDPIAGDAG